MSVYVHIHDADWKEDEHPREKGGEFTSGGGSSGGGKAESETEEKKDYIGTQAHMQELADSIVKQYGLHPIKVEMNDLGGDHAIGVAGGHTHINLNSKFFTPENMAKFAKEWEGMNVGSVADDPQRTAAGIILHEIGHVVMHQVAGQGPEGTMRNKKVREWRDRWQKVEDLASKHYDRQHNGESAPVSPYGQDDSHEFAAEAFAAYHLGETSRGAHPDFREKGLANAKAFWDEMLAMGIPPRLHTYGDAAWKEEEHNRGGDPANPGRFSKGGSAGLHAPKAEAPKPASAPSPASEAPARVRKPDGISVKMHKDLGDFGFRYKGVEPHTVTEGGRDYTNEMVRYEHANGDTIKIKRGPDEEAIWWELELPRINHKATGYGASSWQDDLVGLDYVKASKRKREQATAIRQTAAREKYPAHFHAIEQMAAKYDYPVEKFEVLEPGDDARFNSSVNGRAFIAAGWAEPHTGKIVINATVLQSLNQIIAHEILHQKQFAAERTDKAVKDYMADNFEKLRQDDGLTSYSRDWWANFEAVSDKRQSSPLIYHTARWSAVAETLAEMAFTKETAPWKQFTSSYEELYRMINRAYASTLEKQRQRQRKREAA